MGACGAWDAVQLLPYLSAHPLQDEIKGGLPWIAPVLVGAFIGA